MVVGGFVIVLINLKQEQTMSKIDKSKLVEWINSKNNLVRCINDNVSELERLINSGEFDCEPAGKAVGVKFSDNGMNYTFIAENGNEYIVHLTESFDTTTSISTQLLKPHKTAKST